MQRPNSNEYAPYYKNYVALVPDGDLLEIIKQQTEMAFQFYQSIPEEKWSYRYAEGKWSVKESFVHLLDAERVFAYRALRIARGDKTALPGFDQDAFVEQSNADQRSVASILAEYQATRQATIALFSTFPNEAFDAIGVASNADVSVRGLGYILAGHELHHLNVFREKYEL